MNNKFKVVLSLILVLTMVMGGVASASSMVFYNEDTEKAYYAELSEEDIEELIAASIAGDKIAKVIKNKLVNYNEVRDAVAAKVTEAVEAGKTIEEALLEAAAAVEEIVEELEEVQIPAVELEVVEVSAITDTNVKVTFEALEEKLEDVTVTVLDGNGAEVEVEAITIAKGATSATFSFVEKYEGKLEGVWKVAGVEFDFADIKLVADIKTANIVQLAQLLNNEAKFSNYIEENIDLYHAEKEKPAVKNALKTVKDVQKLVIDAVNEAEEGSAEYDAFAKEFKEAKTQLAKFNLLKAKFNRIHDEDMTTIMDTSTSILVKTDSDGDIAIDSAKAATMDAIQDVIDTLNIKNAKAEVDTLDKTTYDSKPSEIAAAKALVVALVDSDDIKDGGENKEDLLTTIETLEEKVEEALEDAAEAVELAEEAMTAHLAAGGKEDDGKYEAVKDEVDGLAKADLSAKTINAHVTALGDGKDSKAINDLLDATKLLTILDDADAALDAYLAAGGKDDDTVYTDVESAITAYDPTDDGTTFTSLENAIEALEDASEELLIYADVLGAKTVAEMRSALFDLAPAAADFLNLSSAVKTDFAEYVLAELAEEDPAPADFAALQTAVFTTYKGAYDSLISAVNAATDIEAMITKLEDLNIKGFDKLGEEAQADAASNVFENKPTSGYTTIADIEAAMGL